MRKTNELIKERLMSVMRSDRSAGIENLIAVLKSDLYELLKCYMAIDKSDVRVEVSQTASDDYIFTFSAKTDRILEVGKMLRD